MLINKLKIKLVVYIVLLIGASIGCIYWGNKNVNSDKQIDMDYKMIDSNDVISGKITKWHFRGLHKYSSSWRVDKEQLVTFPWAENWAYPKRHLFLFLQENDSIYKPRHSDTLYIYRNNEQFHFVLKKRIFK